MINMPRISGVEIKFQYCLMHHGKEINIELRKYGYEYTQYNIVLINENFSYLQKMYYTHLNEET